jgi:hypothetical protein
VRPLLPGGRALPATRPHRPTARTAADVKQRQPRHEQQKLPARTTPPPTLLDQTTTAALPRDRVHLTHGTCRGALNPLIPTNSSATWCTIPPKHPVAGGKSLLGAHDRGNAEPANGAWRDVPCGDFAALAQEGGDRQPHSWRRR